MQGNYTICVATKEECNLECKRRNLTPTPFNQGYSNFSLDFKKGNKCKAYIGYGKWFNNKKKPRII